MHIACPHCLAINRIPDDRLADDPGCGRCGKALLDGHPIELDDRTLDTMVTRTDLPIVIDFWAPWCGPCRQMAPQFQAAAAQSKGHVLFTKVNSDDNPAASARYAIRSIPTLVLTRGGQEVARRSGASSSVQILQWLHTYIH